jgi:hypothetical protein
MEYAELAMILLSEQVYFTTLSPAKNRWNVSRRRHDKKL